MAGGVGIRLAVQSERVSKAIFRRPRNWGKHCFNPPTNASCRFVQKKIYSLLLTKSTQNSPGANSIFRPTKFCRSLCEKILQRVSLMPAIRLPKKNPSAVVVVSPADHLILKEEEFQTTIHKSVEHAKSKDKLITLGIKPARPETGLRLHPVSGRKKPLKKVKTFTEKPELSLAKKFVESGDFV